MIDSWSHWCSMARSPVAWCRHWHGMPADARSATWWSWKHARSSMWLTTSIINMDIITILEGDTRYPNLYERKRDGMLHARTQTNILEYHVIVDIIPICISHNQRNTHPAIPISFQISQIVYSMVMRTAYNLPTYLYTWIKNKKHKHPGQSSDIHHTTHSQPQRLLRPPPSPPSHTSHETNRTYSTWHTNHYAIQYINQAHVHSIHTYTLSTQTGG